MSGTNGTLLSPGQLNSLLLLTALSSSSEPFILLQEGAPSWKDEHQSVAVLGIALIALGGADHSTLIAPLLLSGLFPCALPSPIEMNHRRAPLAALPMTRVCIPLRCHLAPTEELGSEMAAKVLEHVLQYGETASRRAVPLAFALLSASNPKLTVTDALGRLSHDAHPEVAEAAMLAMGLVAAGTNNARVAAQLRQLSSYYYKEPGLLFLVRIAQGLVHMGKGLLTISPFHSDRGLLRKSSLAALLTVCVAGLDMKETLLGAQSARLQKSAR